MKKEQSIRNTTMNLLARREHSASELMRKLQQRGHDFADVEAVIQTLQAENLQSDYRFAESFINQRVNAGFGPVKIRHELKQREVSEDIVESLLKVFAEEWPSRLQQLRTRKFGEKIPQNYTLKMKQARFLQNRGFATESVMRLFR